MRKLIFVSLVLIMAAGCKKDNPLADCYKCTGYAQSDTVICRPDALSGAGNNFTVSVEPPLGHTINYYNCSKQ